MFAIYVLLSVGSLFTSFIVPERQAPITADENRAECQEERQEGDKGDVQAGDQGEQVTLDRSQSFSISYLRKRISKSSWLDYVGDISKRKNSLTSHKISNNWVKKVINSEYSHIQERSEVTQEAEVFRVSLRVLGLLCSCNTYLFRSARTSYRTSVRPPVPSRPQQFFLSSQMS